MNILLYIPSHKQDGGGTTHYTINLLNALKSDKKNNYLIYTLEDAGIKAFEGYRIITPRKFVIFFFIIKLYNKIIRLIVALINHLSNQNVYRFPRPFISTFLIRKYNIDIIYSPYQKLPQCKVPKIVTMHDIQELHFPEYFSSTDRIIRAAMYKQNIDDASGIIWGVDQPPQP